VISPKVKKLERLRPIINKARNTYKGWGMIRNPTKRMQPSPIG
jgi:hypothetical protein